MYRESCSLYAKSGSVVASTEEMTYYCCMNWSECDKEDVFKNRNFVWPSYKVVVASPSKDADDGFKLAQKLGRNYRVPIIYKITGAGHATKLNDRYYIIHPETCFSLEKVDMSNFGTAVAEGKFNPTPAVTVKTRSEGTYFENIQDEGSADGGGQPRKFMGRYFSQIARYVQVSTLYGSLAETMRELKDNLADFGTDDIFEKCGNAVNKKIDEINRLGVFDTFGLTKDEATAIYIFMQDPVFSYIRKCMEKKDRTLTKIMFKFLLYVISGIRKIPYYDKNRVVYTAIDGCGTRLLNLHKNDVFSSHSFCRAYENGDIALNRFGKPKFPVILEIDTCNRIGRGLKMFTQTKTEGK